jgi:hypothetical protein
VPAVPFQVELAFEGVEDRLDGLAQRFDQRRAGPVIQERSTSGGAMDGAR